MQVDFNVPMDKAGNITNNQVCVTKNCHSPRIVRSASSDGVVSATHDVGGMAAYCGGDPDDQALPREGGQGGDPDESHGPPQRRELSSLSIPHPLLSQFSTCLSRVFITPFQRRGPWGPRLRTAFLKADTFANMPLSRVPYCRLTFVSLPHSLPTGVAAQIHAAAGGDPTGRAP